MYTECSRTVPSATHLYLLFYQIWHSGSLNTEQRATIQKTLLETDMSADELAAIDRIVHAVRRGWLTMVD